MNRSHRTAELTNYFDENDVRVRENPYCVDAQLLNVAALSIDDCEQRVSREVNSRSLRTVPANIDNRGIYYAAKVPNSFPISPEGSQDPQIEAQGDYWHTTAPTPPWTFLTPYDDRLPVPASIERDLSITPVSLPNPVILDVTGSGDGLRQVWDIKQASPGRLAIGNVVSFWLEGFTLGQVDVLISGQLYPEPAWSKERKRYSEVVRSSSGGLFFTKYPWSRIDQITIRGLPLGARLRAWVLPVNTPAVFDVDRPYTDPGYRDKKFDSYSSVSGNLLKSSYFSGNFGGLERITSCTLPESCISCAIEPNTWGIFVASQTKIYYSDRREQVPSDLSGTGIFQEPLYGIRIQYNEDLTTSIQTYVKVLPLAYGYSSQGVQYRYLVRLPSGITWILTPEGALAQSTPGTGWRLGVPKVVDFALPGTGDYVFTIQCMDGQGQIVSDVYPYSNSILPTLAAFDLRSSVSSIKGIAFDHLGRLWVWDGLFAIPMKMSYKGYVIDRSTNTIYITDPYAQVRVT